MDAKLLLVPGFQRCPLPVPRHFAIKLVVIHGFGMLVSDEQTVRFSGPCTLLHKGGACEIVNMGASTLEMRLETMLG